MGRTRQTAFRRRPPPQLEGTIHDAVIRANLEQVKAMLAADRALMNSQHDGNTPLRLAVLCGHLDVVSVLIECGADASELKDEARPETSIVAEAFRAHRVEIVDLLLSHRAQFPGLPFLLGTFAQSRFAYDLRIPMLKVLVRRECFDLSNIDDTLSPPRPHTLLCEAVLRWQTYTVASLLHAGADPRASPAEAYVADAEGIPSWVERVFEEHEATYRLVKARWLIEGVAFVNGGRGPACYEATQVPAYLEGRVAASRPLPVVVMPSADAEHTAEDGTVPHRHCAPRSPTVTSPGTVSTKRRAVEDSSSDRSVQRAVVKLLVFQGFAEQKLLPELMKMSD